VVAVVARAPTGVVIFRNVVDGTRRRVIRRRMVVPVVGVGWGVLKGLASGGFFVVVVGKYITGARIRPSGAIKVTARARATVKKKKREKNTAVMDVFVEPKGSETFHRQINETGRQMIRTTQQYKYYTAARHGYVG